MATAKKTASARPSKGAAVKRSYQRRAKPEVAAEVPAEEQQQSAEAGQASTSPVVTLEGKLQEIEVIDLRNLPVGGRFALFQTLENLGYLEQNSLQPILSSECATRIGLFNADAVKLNHTNKLMLLSMWGEVADSRSISRINISVKVGIEFSEPTPVDPDQIMLGNSLYMRVPQ